MKKTAWILAAFFGLVLLGAVALNADLVSRSRAALAGAGISGFPEADAARLHLLVVLPDSDDGYFTGLLEGIEAAAPEAGVAIQVERYPPSSPEESRRWFEIGLRSGVDGILMYAARSDDIQPYFDFAEAAGVVFVAVGKEAPGGVITCFVGSAPLFHGFEGGRIITGLLAQRARIGIILPSGGSGSPEDDSLYKGVAAAVATYRGAEIVATLRTGAGPFAAEEAAAVILGSHPEINAFFCATSRDTLGAAQVVVDRGLEGKVAIVGADETPELLRHLANGVVAASIVRDSRAIGVEAVRAFASIEAGRPPPGVIELDFTVRLREAAE
ncbi:MAG: sugar ABC transporter substrate-binding protein [Spirochaetales bacterium]|nr:sugar ABC transporter substrate-binding protein [Spirochaetales bacterium]